MYALSIRQPWAELIARGKKKIEYRSWSRSHRGDLLVVASASRHDDECAKERLAPEGLAYGAAVCVVDVWQITGRIGDYEWHLRNPRRVAPEPLRGFASLYRVDDARVRFVAEPERRSVRPLLAGAPRALVVSGSLARARSWQQALIDRGFNVHRVRDGFGAWNFLGASPDVACVVLDGEIEGLLANEVVRRMRRSRASAETPVVLVDGRGGPPDEAGKVHFLRKNASPADVSETAARASGHI